MTMNETRPFIRLRGRSIMALVLSPDPPLDAWLDALDAQIERAPNFFDGRPVIADLGSLPTDTTNAAGLLRAIEARGIHVIGVEGAHKSWPGLEPWGKPLPGAGKAGRPMEIVEQTPPAPVAQAPAPTAPTPAPAAAKRTGPPSLVVNQTLRSGQSVSFEDGDVTIIGSVASGAEVVAGGSIHVYGALRGRAIAGLKGDPKARIFCSKFHAELVAIDGVYQTAEDMPRDRIGAPASAWLEGYFMRITAIE
jgi:septum site-determining protein MinC